MEILPEIKDQLAKLPAWSLVMFGLIGFSIYWKKSNWPNRVLPIINLVIPIVAYPALAWNVDIGQLYFYPLPVLIFHGFLIGVGAEVFHDILLDQIKKRFPGIKFPDEPPKVTVSTETKTETK